MYAFADETGNTGENLFDANQPHFLTAALVTRANFDVRYRNAVASLASVIGETSLHASRLGPSKIEAIAPKLHEILRASGARFAISHIEKRYLLSAKIVDHIFDSGENLAVPWQAYNFRFLRMLIVFKATYLLDEPTARIFWSSLMAARPQEAQAQFVNGCKILSDRVDSLPDKRSREIFGEALLWAIANPEAINLFSHGRMRYSHLPNYVGFVNLLSGIENWSIKWQSPVRKIFHDRQSQFEKLFTDWHKIFSSASDDELTIPGDFEPVVLQKVFGSELVIKNSADSAGIQVVDLVLWLINRIIREDQLGPGATHLLSYVLRHARFHRFSFAGANDLMRQLNKKYPKFEEIDEATMKKAKEIQATMEQTRQSRMLEYSQNKLIQSTSMDKEN